MHYEINVSHGGFHLFATHPRSIQSISQLQRVLHIFLKKFKEEDGFEMSIKQIEEGGKFISIENAMKLK